MSEAGSGGRIERPGADTLYRAGSVGAVALVAGAYLSVLYHVVDVAGDVALFVAVAAGSAVLGVAVGRLLRGRTAVAVGLVLLAAGLGWYVSVLPPAQAAKIPVRFHADLAAMLTGYSVIQFLAAGAWAVGVTPGPTFLTGYFLARGETVRAAVVAALTLGLVVLTGDSGQATTLVGVVGAAGAAGLDSLSRYGVARGRIEAIVVAVAVMVVAATTVTAVPAGAGVGGGANDGRGTASATGDLLSTQSSLRVGGSIDLTPTVRFVVDSKEPRYWRTNAFDRYTGDGWVRTGGTRPADGNLPHPPGDRRTLVQTYEARTAADVLPAAAEPVAVNGADAEVTALGTVAPAEALATGERYSVLSRVPDASEAELRRAGTDYPDEVRARYLQLPASTPDRLRERAANVTAGAETPYAKAEAIERYLEETKGYTTTVARPDGNVADAFLFEMDAGYCVYFATTMVAMLRAEGVPARMAVGYATGQQVSDSEYVVRGLDSHAWVEVYVPDQGWVRFDPTPAAPRSAAERDSIQAARLADQENVDAAGSENVTFTTTEGETTTTTLQGGERAINVSNDGQQAGPQTQATTPASGGPDGGDGSSLPSLPGLDRLALWVAVIVGLAAAGRRSGVTDRVYRAAWLRWQPESGDPTADAVGAYARVEYLLGRAHRPRRAGESVRAYLDAVNADDRARRVAAVRERALYGGGVSAAEAAEARTLAAEFVSERAGGPATVFNRLIS